MSTYRREMMENGVEPVQVWSHPGPGRDPRESRKKNAADIQLVVDALTVAGEAPWIDVFAIVSGDGDFIPLIRRLQFLGKVVIGVTIRHTRAGGVSQDLRAAVDHFIDLQVGDELSVPAPAVPTAADTLDGKERADIRPMAQVVPSNKAPSLEEYVATTHRFTKDYPQTMRDGDVDGAFMNGLLRRQWPRVTYSDFGFRSFGAFIEDGCGLSIFHPHTSQSMPSQPPNSAQAERAEISEGVLSDSSRQKTVAHDPAADLESALAVGDATSLRTILEEASPQVSYPTHSALTDVLTELTLQISPLAPEDLLDLVGDELPDVSAEQIRKALSLLFTIGAFREDEAAGTIVLSADIASVDDGVRLVLQDAERRAQTIGREVDFGSIREAVFPSA